MSVTIEDRFNAFCEYVQRITGRPVLKARRGMNFQPSEPYISIDLLSCQLVPKDDWHYEDSNPGQPTGTIKQVVRGLIYAVFQVKSFGGTDAVQILHKLHTSLKTDDWQYWAYKNEFGLGENEGVENLSSELLSTAFENRAQMRVSLYTPCPVEFDAGYFTWGNITFNVEEKQEQYEFEYGTKPPSNGE